MKWISYLQSAMYGVKHERNLEVTTAAVLPVQLDTELILDPEEGLLAVKPGVVQFIMYEP